MELPNYGEAYTVLSGRYALMECLAESASGKLYRGRDLDKIRDHALVSQVLIHVLPATLALSAQNVFQQIQQACAGLSTTAGILPAYAYGKDAATAYIVLESPTCAGTQSLSRTTTPHTAQRSIAPQRLARWLKQHALPQHLDPALLLSTPKQQLYVLATALTPAIQALTQTQQGGESVAGQRYLRRLSIGASVAALMVFSAVTAHALMKQTAPVSSHTPSQTSSTLPAVPPPPVAQPPVQQPTVSTAKPEPVAAKHVVQSKPADTKVAKPKEAVEPNPPVAKVVKPKAVEPKVATTSQTPPVKQPVESKAPPTSATVVPEQPAVKAKPITATETTLPEPEPIIKQVVVDDTAVQIDNAIQQAYRALHAGRLSDAPQGALRFTRELRGLAPQHPQVARLGQEITAAYLRHIRAALQAHDLPQVARLLPVTRQLIAEFKLTNLEAAQQVLENKLVELNG